MDAFDGNTYRKAVLKPLLTEAPGTLDPFAVLAIPPDAEDRDAIEARIAQVVAFWRREQTSARYRALVTRLLDERDHLRAQFIDPARRDAIRASAEAARAEADQTRLARLDGLIERLVRSHPAGVPRSRLDRLRALMERDGVPGAELAARLEAVPVLDDRAEPLDPAERTRLRTTLAAYNQLLAADGNHRPARSLFDILGVDPSAPDEDVRAHHDSLVTRNRQRRHDRRRTLTDELLMMADRWAHGPGRARYHATLVADARDALVPEIEAALLVDDRVGAADFEHLVREAIGLGLAPGTARTTVIAAAAELGGAVETGPAVDYVRCPACGTVEPIVPGDAEHTRRTCRRCGTDLYRPCPSCGRELVADAYRCPYCGTDFQAEIEAEAERRERFRQASQLDGVAKERALAALVEEHPGFEPALRVLRSLPPAPPTDLRATAGADSIIVAWHEGGSPQVSSYRVTRQQGDDRPRMVGQTQTLSLEDAGARPGQLVRYEVVAVRGGLESPPASVELTALFEVAAVAGRDVDGTVELTWRPPRAGTVWLERTVEGPGSAGAAHRQRLEGAVHIDRDVQAGRTYRYHLSVEHETPGGPPVRSAGRSVLVPIRLPPGVVRLSIEATDRELNLRAGTTRQGEVRIVRASVAPPAPGTHLDPAALGALGPVLPHAGGPGRSVDLLAGDPRWYVPVTVDAAGGGLVGPAVAHPGLPPATEVSVSDDGDDVVVRWHWPHGCTEALVTWQGPAGAGQAKVTNMKYQIDGGARLSAAGAGTYEVEVRPGARLGRELLWVETAETVRHSRA
jgi:hypothetical protein